MLSGRRPFHLRFTQAQVGSMASQAAGSQASSAMEQEARGSPPPDADIDWENTPVLSWMHPVFTGRSIIARGGHASALVGNLLITFGGHYFGKDKFMCACAHEGVVSAAGTCLALPHAGIATTCGPLTWTP